MERIKRPKKEIITVWRVYQFPVDDDMDDDDIDRMIESGVEENPDNYCYQAETEEEVDKWVDMHGDEETHAYSLEEMDVVLPFEVGDIILATKGQIVGRITHMKGRYAIIKRINAAVEILYHVDLIYSHIAEKHEIAEAFKSINQP